MIQKSLYLLTLLCLNLFQAQTKINPPKPILCPELPKKEISNYISYSEVQVKPKFPEGLDAFSKYIKNSIDFRTQISKIVIVSFIVEKDGTLSDVTIISEEIDSKTKNSIKDSIQNSPLWLAAQHDGYDVRCKISLPIKLNETTQ